MSTRTVLSRGPDGVHRPIQEETVSAARIARGLAAAAGLPLADAQRLASDRLAGRNPEPLSRHEATILYAERHSLTYAEAQRELVARNTPAAPVQASPEADFGKLAMRDPRGAARKLSAERGIPIGDAQAIVKRAIESARAALGGGRP